MTPCAHRFAFQRMIHFYATTRLKEEERETVTVIIIGFEFYPILGRTYRREPIIVHQLTGSFCFDGLTR